jgi:putative ABC transport system permease protein
MGTTFFKLAFRNIQKNRLNMVINVLGFSLGIAACLFIFLFIKQETSFDDFHSNSNRIYRVTGDYHSKDGIKKIELCL